MSAQRKRKEKSQYLTMEPGFEPGTFRWSVYIELPQRLSPSRYLLNIREQEFDRCFEQWFVDGLKLHTVPLSKCSNDLSCTIDKVCNMRFYATPAVSLIEHHWENTENNFKNYQYSEEMNPRFCCIFLAIMFYTLTFECPRYFFFL